MTATDESMQLDAPQFAVTMRGYDRIQVDDYVDTLRDYLSEAQLRVTEAEESAARLRSELTAARRAEGDTRPGFDSTPVERPAEGIPGRAVADAVNATLAAADELAATLRAEAAADRESARALVESAEAEARGRAAQIIADAEADVERLARRAAHEQARRDRIRRQLGELRSSLDELTQTGTGEIDLTSLAPSPAESDPQVPHVPASFDAERTTLLKLPQ